MAASPRVNLSPDSPITGRHGTESEVTSGERSDSPLKRTRGTSLSPSIYLWAILASGVVVSLIQIGFVMTLGLTAHGVT
jgi:hypothetical protein